MRFIIFIIVALLLEACSPSTTAKLAQIETGIIEPRIDAAYDAALKIWCDAPADTHRRAINRRAITPRSLTDNCGAWRAIRDALIGSTIAEIGQDSAP